MDQSSRTYTALPKSNSLRASQLASVTHQGDSHEQHAKSLTAHAHSTTNPHRKMNAHLGTIPERMVATVTPNHTPNASITRHVYSQPYVIMHGGSKTRRTITSLQVGFVPATKTYLSRQAYGETFMYLSATNELETMAPQVTVDNTSIQYAYIACYLIKTDPYNVWHMANGPHEHFSFPKFETISPVLPLRARWCKMTPTPFDGTDYTALWYSTNSNIWPLRPGPSRAQNQITPLFVPPYTEPSAYYAAHTADPQLMQYWRTSPTTMQSWMPFANGASLGLIFSGYRLRVGPEDAAWVTTDSDPLPTQPAPRHVMEFVQGPDKYSSPIAVYGVGAGNNHIETHLVIDQGESLLIVPSLKPIFTRGPAQSAFEISTLFTSGFDPVFTAAMTSDITSVLAGPIPADGSFQLFPPLNAASDQAPWDTETGTPSPWIMPDADTIPQVLTGFTLTLSEYPISDGAEILLMRVGGVAPANVCQTRSELLPAGTYPSLCLQAIYFDG
jgi:hypothetical protein